MLDFHEKRKLKGYLYSKPMVAGIFLVSALFSTSVYHRFVSEREIAEKQRATATELEVLKEQSAALEAQVAHLKSDRGIEGEIRDRFEVSKKGERVVVVLGDNANTGTTNAATTSSAAKPPEKKPSFWSFLW